MARKERKKSRSGIYHIMLRGINRQTIFEDEEDKRKFLETLKKYKDVSKYQLYSYCLMDNHVHLLIREMDETIAEAIKRISSSYVYWYNLKYERVGHLFQERFKSERVESEVYFLTVLRYIHQNPLKAGLRIVFGSVGGQVYMSMSRK
jgi:putative transposase